MPIDSNYIQATIASQQAYFQAQNNYINSLNNPWQGGVQQQQSQAPGIGIPPMPVMPMATYQSGMNTAPQSVQPFYTSGWSAARGALGFTPDIRFSSQEAMYAGQQDLSRRARAVGGGFLLAAPTLGETIGSIAGMSLGAGLGGMIGGIPGSFIGATIGDTIGSGIGNMAGMAMGGYRGQRMMMASQMENEFMTNPALSRFRPSFGQLEGLAGKLQGMTGVQSQMSGQDVTGLTGLAVQGGQLDVAGNMEEVQKTIIKYIESTRRIAKVLKVSLTEGGKLLNDLKQMGFFDVSSQVQQALAMGGMSNIAGVGVGEMTRIAGAGAQMMGGPWGAQAATSMAGGLGYLSRGSGEAARIISRMGGTGQASMEMMQKMNMAMNTTGIGSVMMASQMAGFGPGTDMGAIGGYYNGNTAAIAEFMDPTKRQQAIAKMMQNPAGVIDSIKEAARRSGRSEAELSNPSILSRYTGGVFNSDEMQLLMEQSRPEVQRAMASAGTRASIRPSEERYGLARRAYDWKFGMQEAGRRVFYTGDPLAEGGAGFFERSMNDITGGNIANLGGGYATTPEAIARGRELAGKYGTEELAEKAYKAESRSIARLLLPNAPGAADSKEISAIQKRLFNNPTPDAISAREALYAAAGDTRKLKDKSYRMQLRSKLMKGGLLNFEQAEKLISGLESDKGEARADLMGARDLRAGEEYERSIAPAIKATMGEAGAARLDKESMQLYQSLLESPDEKKLGAFQRSLSQTEIKGIFGLEGPAALKYIAGKGAKAADIGGILSGTSQRGTVKDMSVNAQNITMTAGTVNIDHLFGKSKIDKPDSTNNAKSSDGQVTELGKQ